MRVEESRKEWKRVEYNLILGMSGRGRKGMKREETREDLMQDRLQR